MTDIPIPLFAAIGMIAAATIAGGISFANLISSKEQKTSEFRQNWIDGLRDEVSTFCSQAQIISTRLYAARKLDTDFDQDVAKKKKFLKDTASNFEELLKLHRKILLRINPDEHSKLVGLVNDIYATFDEGKISDPDAIRDRLNILTGEIQTVLKKEWSRVKRGEMTYIVAKYVALLILGFASAATYAYLSGLISISVKLS